MKQIAVSKQNPAGEETWRYTGEVLRQEQDYILIEAFFNRSSFDLHGIVLEEGDRFFEVYFFNRWYNIFEINNRSGTELKGWYCNVTAPAEYTDGVIAYKDLALDLLVYPDGRQKVLDEDEFDELNLDEGWRQKALEALDELRQVVDASRGFRLAQYLEVQR
jgi:protein associated with RNAse G/E